MMDILTLIGVCVFVYFALRYYKLKQAKYIDNIESKYVLITGCDRGFGRNSAIKFHSLNVKVIAGCLTEEGERELNLSGIKTVRLDVTCQESIDKAFDQVRKILPKNTGLWSLINNAGILEIASPHEWLTVNEYKRIFEVNTFGLINVTLKFLPLIKKEQGRIINIASVAGRSASTYLGPYTASKFAVEGFTDSLRRDMLQWKVSVHTIEPSPYDTGILDVSDSIVKKFENLPEDIINEYGKDYGKDFAAIYKKGVNYVTYKNITPVINTYINAVLSAKPKIRYTVGTSSKILCFLSSHLPDFLIDRYIQKITVVPKPVKAPTT